MKAGLRAVLPVLALLAACSPERKGDDLVFVSDEEANVVHVIDGASGAKEGDLVTGARPRGLALSPDGRTLYVAASNANRIEAWDVAGRHRLHVYDSGSDPERFAVSPDGHTLYIANEDHSAVSFLDLASGRITREVKVGPEPEGMGVSPDGRLVIATSEAASTAHFIDAATGRLIDSIIVGSRPRDALFVGGKLWVSSEQRGTISIIDPVSRRIASVIDLVAAFPDLDSAQAVELKATRDGKRAFVAMGRGNQVAEIDPASFRIVRSFPTGTRNWGIALSPDDGRLYAASGLSGDVTIIDLKANRVLRRVTFKGRPWGVVAARR
ncbi:PQQ-dependent catabolism-associated beta-propeller protein [Sphingomonas quercus]|uniref:PQQ-dependent catabolism-associated beta-propeller protein n=1 Tax=Sphingomonas quercus TaxID=2842451 RepID=A0ABS6BNH1_9SPHN|nr:PQQ-dependent catabolism-associated beta-propeller protein [Sphingomonas quercus]MBU3079346.1 PQQ-dependent catabolism-associated beta-propeller protein [Sphingomonas quercus]